MIKLAASTLAAVTFMTGAALAQAPAPATSPAPTAPVAAPAATVAPKAAAPAVTAPTATAPAATKAAEVVLDKAGEAKFTGFDKNANGTLDGTEVAGFKNDMAKIDTDKDGKISKVEFASALKAGVIK